MRFLLALVSFLFSFIFWVFYKYDKTLNIAGKNFLNKSSYNLDLISIAPSLLIYTFLFILIGIFFFLFFSNYTYEKFQKMNKEDYLGKVFFIIFIFFTLLFQKFLISNLFLKINLLLFFISVFIYNFLLNIKKYRKNIKIIGITSLYFITTLNIIYSFVYKFNFLVFIMLIYSIIFNFYIHKKFTNYISVIFGIISILFLFYFLFFYLFGLYNSYIGI